jgi:hypothetical protein
VRLINFGTENPAFAKRQNVTGFVYKELEKYLLNSIDKLNPTTHLQHKQNTTDRKSGSL